MNKANVFLLAVVSSLLTYISTATQPAASAEVAQEKWEYGVSTMSKSGDAFAHYQLTFNSSSQSGLCSGSVDHGETDWRIVFLQDLTEGGRPRAEHETAEGESLDGETGSRLMKMFWDSIGQEGWQPYQVLPSEDLDEVGRIQSPWSDTTYWRRRVQ